MAETKTTATEVGRDAAERLRESMAHSEFARKAKDAAYTLVGLGVMGAQRATAATKQASAKIGGEGGGDTTVGLKVKAKDASAAARRQLTKADGILEGALARIEEAFAPFEERLPAPAKETVGKVRDASKELHTQVRAKVTGELAEPAPTPKSTPRAKGTTAPSA